MVDSKNLSVFGAFDAYSEVLYDQDSFSCARGESEIR